MVRISFEWGRRGLQGLKPLLGSLYVAVETATHKYGRSEDRRKWIPRGLFVAEGFGGVDLGGGAGGDGAGQ